MRRLRRWELGVKAIINYLCNYKYKIRNPPVEYFAILTDDSLTIGYVQTGPKYCVVIGIGRKDVLCKVARERGCKYICYNCKSGYLGVDKEC